MKTTNKTKNHTMTGWMRDNGITEISSYFSMFNGHFFSTFWTGGPAVSFYTEP